MAKEPRKPKKPKEPKLPKERELKPWIEYSPEQYKLALSRMVHQSFKTVNTNTEAGGVRIPRQAGLKLPYVSARTLIGAGIDVRMDRYEGAGAARIYGQIDEIETGRTEEVPEAVRQLVLNGLNEVRNKSAIAGGEHVFPRMRQILLPHDGSYVAISPVACAGVALEIRQAVSNHWAAFIAESEQAKAQPKLVRTLRGIDNAVFPIGGSNAQNAGMLIYAFQSPLMGSAPRLQATLRQALSVHFKGFERVPIPTSLMEAYLQWRETVGQDTEQNMDIRAVHRDFMHRFARAALQSGANARAILHAYIDRLPLEAQSAEVEKNSQRRRLLSTLVPAWSRGLIDREEREADWPSDMASRLARAISSWVPPKGEPLTLGQREINAMAGYLEEALR